MYIAWMYTYSCVVSVLNSVTNRFKPKQTVLRFPCNGMDGMQLNVAWNPRCFLPRKSFQLLTTGGIKKIFPIFEKSLSSQKGS